MKNKRKNRRRYFRRFSRSICTAKSYTLWNNFL